MYDDKWRRENVSTPKLLRLLCVDEVKNVRAISRDRCAHVDVGSLRDRILSTYSKSTPACDNIYVGDTMKKVK